MENRIILDVNNPNYFFKISLFRKRKTQPFYMMMNFRNDKGDLLEITNNLGDIDSIECITCNSAEEMEIAYPSLESIKKAPIFSYTPILLNEEEYLDTFAITYSKEKINILFSNNLDEIVRYYQEDRITYYLDRKSQLLSIVINDLTPEEYNIIKTKAHNNKHL